MNTLSFRDVFFPLVKTIPLEGSEACCITVGDFDGDSHNEYLVGDRFKSELMLLKNGRKYLHTLGNLEQLNITEIELYTYVCCNQKDYMLVILNNKILNVLEFDKYDDLLQSSDMSENLSDGSFHCNLLAHTELPVNIDSVKFKENIFAFACNSEISLYSFDPQSYTFSKTAQYCYNHYSQDCSVHSLDFVSTSYLAIGARSGTISVLHIDEGSKGSASTVVKELDPTFITSSLESSSRSHDDVVLIDPVLASDDSHLKHQSSPTDSSDLAEQLQPSSTTPSPDSRNRSAGSHTGNFKCRRLSAVTPDPYSPNPYLLYAASGCVVVSGSDDHTSNVFAAARISGAILICEIQEEGDGTEVLGDGDGSTRPLNRCWRVLRSIETRDTIAYLRSTTFHAPIHTPEGSPSHPSSQRYFVACAWNGATYFIPEAVPDEKGGEGEGGLIGITITRTRSPLSFRYNLNTQISTVSDRDRASLETASSIRWMGVYAEKSEWRAPSQHSNQQQQHGESEEEKRDLSSPPTLDADPMIAGNSQKFDPITRSTGLVYLLTSGEVWRVPGVDEFILNTGPAMLSQLTIPASCVEQAKSALETIFGYKDESLDREMRHVLPDFLRSTLYPNETVLEKKIIHSKVYNKRHDNNVLGDGKDSEFLNIWDEEITRLVDSLFSLSSEEFAALSAQMTEILSKVT